MGTIKTRIGVLIAEMKLQGHKVTYRSIQQATGISKTTTTRWVNNTAHDYNRDVLARYCEFFSVTPGDILIYVSDEEDNQ